MRKRTSSPALTAERLERAAYRYLERFSASRAHFRRVLERKIRRSNPAFAPPTTEQAAWIEDIVARLTDLDLLDDRKFADSRARMLALRGVPLRRIAARLAADGVASQEIADALAVLAEEAGGAEEQDFAAACRFARRRRLGPFRKEPADPARRHKEIAALARAGFSPGLARAIVDAGDEAALAELEPSRAALGEE